MIVVYRQTSDGGDKETVSQFPDKASAEKFIVAEIEKFAFHGHDAEMGRWWARDEPSPPHYYYWTE